MARVDRRLLTVPVGWRDRAAPFLKLLDEMIGKGVFPLRQHSLPLDWRKKPLLQLTTVKSRGESGEVRYLRRLVFNPHSLIVQIPRADGAEMQSALDAEIMGCCERCGARGAKPRLLYGWENRCDLHNAKARRTVVRDEVPDTEV